MNGPELLESRTVPTTFIAEVSLFEYTNARNPSVCDLGQDQFDSGPLCAANSDDFVSPYSLPAIPMLFYYDNREGSSTPQVNGGYTYTTPATAQTIVVGVNGGSEEYPDYLYRAEGSFRDCAPGADPCRQRYAFSFFNPRGTWKGSVFEDEDGNGIMEVGDAPLSGMVVAYNVFESLLTSVVAGSGQCPTTLANYCAVTSAGSYSISGEVGNTENLYRIGASVVVDRTLPGGAGFWTKTHGAGARHISGSTITLDSIGLFNGTIAGKLFEDMDADGIADTNELPLPAGVVVFQDWDDDGNLDKAGFQNSLCEPIEMAEPCTVTDDQGRYRLKGLGLLPSGHVRAILPGWRQTSGDGPVAVRSSTTAPNDVGMIHKTTGRVFTDQDGDGQQDPEDLPRAGIRVFVDLNGDGVHGPSGNGTEPLVTTDANGDYTFNYVGPGTIRAVSPGIPASLFTITTVDGTGRFDSLNVIRTYDANFGVFRNVSLYGQLFRDTNGDGIRDHYNDPFVSGALVHLDLNNDGDVERNATTDAIGYYEFRSVGPGTHRLSPMLGDGEALTTPEDPGGFAITTVSGNAVGPLLFGISEVARVPPSIVSLEPSAAPNTVTPGFFEEPLTVTITGAGFSPGATVSFGNDITVAAVRVLSPTQIEVDLNGFNNLPEGDRAVRVVNRDGQSAVDPDAFFISNLAITDVEVNQGVVGMECSDEIPCVANHNTVIRVTMDCNEANCAQRVVAPMLYVIRDGETPTRTAAENAQTFRVLQRGTEYTRGVRVLANDRLNYFFTSDRMLPEGEYEFVVAFDPRQPEVEPNSLTPNTKDHLLRRLESQTFREIGETGVFLDFGIRIAALLDPALPSSVVATIPQYLDFLRATYPISSENVEVSIFLSDFGYQAPLVELFGEPTLEALQRWLASAQASPPVQFTHAILFTNSAEFTDRGLAACSETVVDERFEVFCWENVMIVKVPSDANSTTGDVGMTVAHEMGHTYKLGETYFNAGGDQTGGDEIRSWHNMPNDDCEDLGNGCPVQDGFMDTILGTVSVVREGILLPSDYSLAKRDLMGNSAYGTRWIDGRTWSYLYDKFTGIGPGARSARQARAAGDQLLISGTIRNDESAGFFPFLKHTGNLSPNDMPPGDYSIELLDGAGQVLTSRSFTPAWPAPRNLAQPQGGYFVLSLPFADETASIVLRHGAMQLTARSVSENSPTVHVVMPNGGPIGDTSTITWEGSDTDGDALTYTVLYAPDGVNFVPLATDLQGTSYTWDTSLSAGSANGTIMVWANDGVHQGEDVSDAPLVVGSKPPFVAITSPATGTEFDSNKPVVLEGSGYDLEDGEVPLRDLTFTSDRDGVLGHGRRLTFKGLSVGTHTIILSAIDSDGKSSDSTITVSVRASDVVGPTVDAVSIVTNSHGKKVTQIVLEFSEPIDAAAAQTIGNYALTSQKGRKFKRVQIGSVAYDAAAAEVTVTPAKTLSVKSLGTHRLTVRGNGTLADIAGNGFDGDGDGVGGGDFVRLLSQATTRSALRTAVLATVDEVLASDHLLRESRDAGEWVDQLLEGAFRRARNVHHT